MHCGRPLGQRNPKKKNLILETESTREYCHECLRKHYHRSSYITQAKSLYLYTGAIKQTMYRFKYSNKREYAEFFAKEAIKHHATWLKHVGVEAIIPVPMHKSKQKKRGYNQAEVFAKELSQRTQARRTNR